MFTLVVLYMYTLYTPIPSKNKRVITAWSRAWSQTVITGKNFLRVITPWSRRDDLWSQKMLWSEITEIEGVITDRDHDVTTDRDHDVITGTGVMITP